MLLAEALALRADRQKLLKELTGRIEDNARAPDGAAPDEDPNELLERASSVAGELTDIVRRINRTNASTKASGDTNATISDLIAERDQAQRMTQLYRAVAKAGTRGAGRGLWTRDADSPTRAVVDVSELQRSADEWGVRYREIDVRLQQLNWSTELVTEGRQDSDRRVAGYTRAFRRAEFPRHGCGSPSPRTRYNVPGRPGDAGRHRAPCTRARERDEIVNGEGGRWARS